MDITSYALTNPCGEAMRDQSMLSGCVGYVANAGGLAHHIALK